MKKIFLVISFFTVAIPVMASSAAYTYEDVQGLKKESPSVASAYLKGMAEGLFSFRVVESGIYTFCPPVGTRIDFELVELMATNEVRLHGANRSDLYSRLVYKGINRSFPCGK